MNKKSKDLINFVLRVGISAGLLWYLYTIIDVKKTAELISQADYSYVLYAFVLFLFINGLLVVRWFVFIRALELQVPKLQIVRYFFAGLAGNLFLPSAIGGDIIKIAGMCHHCPDKKHTVVGSVVLDRIAGYCGLILIALVGFGIGFRFIQDPGLIGPILFIIPGFITMLFLMFHKGFNAWAIKVTKRFPRVQKGLMKFHEDMTLMAGRQRYGFLAVGMACVGQIVFAGCFYLVAKSLHQDVSLIYFLIFVPLICAASALPSIGGLGAREAGAAFLFSRIGVDSGVAVSISLMTFVFMVVVGLMGGLYYVATLSSGRVQHPLPDSGVS